MKHRLAVSIISVLAVATLGGAIRQLAAFQAPEPGTVLVVAGIGKAGTSGDGGPAIQARLNIPHALAFNALGDLLIADAYSYRVRRVTPNGIISTIAGSGVQGSDDRNNRPALQARFGIISDLALDGAGNLFISEPFNHQVRKLSPDGMISTWAGTGRSGYSGDGGPAAEAQLFLPGGLAVDGDDNLFIVDINNYRVRKVTPAGIISTVAGSGKKGSSGDEGSALDARLGDSHGGLAIDAAGNLYIPDQDNHRIRKVDRAGRITTVAGTGERGFSGDGGLATQAKLSQPHDVAVDSAGNLFITDWRNYRVRMVRSDGIITTVAGSGKKGFAGVPGLHWRPALMDPSVWPWMQRGTSSFRTAPSTTMAVWDRPTSVCSRCSEWPLRA